MFRSAPAAATLLHDILTTVVAKCATSPDRGRFSQLSMRVSEAVTEETEQSRAPGSCVCHLTLAMASVMESTIPPTIPTSLAASLSVTMMSSTASFMSIAASAIASWVWDACV